MAGLNSPEGASTVSATMSWIDKLERRIGFIAFPGLIRAVVAFNGLVWLLVWLNPGFERFLALDPLRILHGEVWRLLTYIFVPPMFGFWTIFALMFLWFIGEGLERAWGAFRVTLFYLLGMIGTTIAAFFFGSNFSNAMLNASLFFAFARFYPDEMIYIFFILPVKIKWLAWISAVFLLLGFVSGPNSYRMALVVALSNYLIFFGPEIVRDARDRRGAKSRRRRFESDSRQEEEPLHRCATCGATELTDPNLDFRISKDGEEYCVAHLPQTQKVAR